MGSATVQGRLWGAAAQDWAELQEPTATPLWEAMLNAAAVGSGTRFLDAGCGAGGASVLAASRGAQVNGLDAAAALLAIARQRVPDGDFQVGELEALPYADAAFDAIIAANVLPYVADPAAALRDLRRVCATQGRLVIAWGAPDNCDEHAIATAVQGILPAPLGEAPWTLAALGAIEALSTQAGLRVIGGGVVTCPCFYPDRETAWQAQVSTGPLQAALRVVGAGQLREAVLQAVAPYTTRTGGIRLEQRFRYLTLVPRDDEHDRVMTWLEQPKGAGPMHGTA